MRLIERPVLLLDVQTTGATPAHGRILELAWCVASAEASADEAALAARTTSLVVAGEGEVPVRILRLTGITPDEVAAGCEEGEAFAALARAAVDVSVPSQLLAAAHFAIFEARFVDDLWQRLASAPPPFTWICTNQIARRLFPNLPSRSLRALAGFFGDPLGPSKRAGAHVVATARIWRRVCDELERREGITAEADLAAWLQQKAPKRSGARAYPIDRTLRLALPDEPGIYRMLARDGRILYVGKATSLRSRVNSYFRQRKGHASAKLELLTQVVDVQVTACETAVEAALLETDEIKRIAPPYNVALRGEGRELGYFDRELRQTHDAAAAVYGPLARADALDGVLLVAALMGMPARTVLARGIWAARVERALAAEDDEDGEDGEDGEDAEDGEDPTDEPAEAPPAELTPEELASRLWSLVRGAGHAWLRARSLARLREAVVAFKGPGERLWRVLRLEAGAVASRAWADAAAVAALPPPRRAAPWTSPERIDISTFDRVSVLASELLRLRTAGGTVAVHYADQGATPDGMDRLVQAARRAPPEDHRADPP